MAGLIVTMAATRLRLFVQTAQSLACTCAGMAVGVLRLSGFVVKVLFLLIALTAPMSLTLGQTALCMHKTTPFLARDSRETLPKYVTDIPHVLTVGTNCSPLVLLLISLALVRPVSIRARTVRNALERNCFATLSKIATVERTRRPSIAKTNVSHTQSAGLSTSVMKVVVYGDIWPAALLISHCVRMATT